jgi:hypothetical protein
MSRLSLLPTLSSPPSVVPAGTTVCPVSTRATASKTQSFNIRFRMFLTPPSFTLNINNHHPRPSHAEIAKVYREDNSSECKSGSYINAPALVGSYSEDVGGPNRLIIASVRSIRMRLFENDGKNGLPLALSKEGK